MLDTGTLVMLTGPAADAFASRCGLPLVEQTYFTTDRRRKSLASMKRRGETGHASLPPARPRNTARSGRWLSTQTGHLAAATSTGGYTNKPAGRVGDSPIIGAGTYARDGVCAVSGTGQGEYFIRHVLGHEIASRMAYLGEDLENGQRSRARRVAALPDRGRAYCRRRPRRRSSRPSTRMACSAAGSPRMATSASRIHEEVAVGRAPGRLNRSAVEPISQTGRKAT